MHYAQMRRYDVTNGPGIRATLFVSGCPKRCINCHNPEAQQFDYGTPWNDQTKQTFLTYCKASHVTGITILGGEPFAQTQDTALFDLLTTIRKTIKKPIWIYSGFLYEELLKNPKQKALLEQCDILIDGPYIEALKDLNLKYRGSSNQRIIAIQESLAKDKSVEKILTFK